MTILGNPTQDILLRELIYGESQRKKSWWAGATGNAGFNVLVLNGDKPATIYKQLPLAAQSKLRIVNVFDKFNFADLVARLLRGDKVWWDIDKSSRALVGMQDKTHQHFLLDFSKLGPNDVVVCDSWTGLVGASIQKLATERKVDLSEIGKLEWDLYGPAAMHLTWMLQQFKMLQSHFILIGHSDIYEKHKKKSDGKPSAEIEFTRTQPISSSRPHAQTLAKYFTDTLYFYMVGNQHYISTESTSERDGGSTTVGPKNWKWDDLQFTDLCKAAGIPFPVGDIPMPACEYIPAGSLGTTNETKSVEPAGNQNQLQVPLGTGTGKTMTLADLALKRNQ